MSVSFFSFRSAGIFSSQYVLSCALIALSSLIPLSSNAQSAIQCAALRDCIDNGVPALSAGCFASNPSCVTTNQDKYAVSAGVIAMRAIQDKRCDTRQFGTKEQCNLCYARATKPLKDRFFGALFKGLLGESTKRIEEARKLKCDAV